MAGQLARFWKTCTLPIKGLWLEGGGDDTSQPIIINSARMEGRGARSEREGGRRGGKGGRRLPRPRPCSVVGDVRALESGLYLTPNQLRSAVPDKVSSLPSPPPPPRVANGAYIHRRHRRPGWLKPTSLGCHSRGRPAKLYAKSPGAKYTGRGGLPHPPLLFVFSPSLASFTSSFSSMACMHPGNELSLATL